jgi:hypothetical protein
LQRAQTGFKLPMRRAKCARNGELENRVLGIAGGQHPIYVVIGNSIRLGANLHEVVGEQARNGIAAIRGSAQGGVGGARRRQHRLQQRSYFIGVPPMSGLAVCG